MRDPIQAFNEHQKVRFLIEKGKKICIISKLFLPPFPLANKTNKKITKKTWRTASQATNKRLDTKYPQTTRITDPKDTSLHLIFKVKDNGRVPFNITMKTSFTMEAVRGTLYILSLLISRIIPQDGAVVCDSKRCNIPA